jgi:hypothetical protein
VAVLGETQLDLKSGMPPQSMNRYVFIVRKRIRQSRLLATIPVMPLISADRLASFKELPVMSSGF